MGINYIEELLRLDAETQLLFLFEALIRKGVISLKDLEGEIIYDMNGQEVFEGNSPEKVDKRRDRLKALGAQHAKKGRIK